MYTEYIKSHVLFMLHLLFSCHGELDCAICVCLGDILYVYY